MNDVRAQANNSITNTYWVYKDLDGVTWPTYSCYVEWCNCTTRPYPSKLSFMSAWCENTKTLIPSYVVPENDAAGWKGHKNELAVQAAAAPQPATDHHSAATGTYVPGMVGAGAPPSAPAAGWATAGQPTLTEVLAERKKQHGDFTDHARIAQDFKTTLRVELLKRTDRDQPPLSDTQREAVEMILHKIARIVAGDANHDDHWRDIAGYATITADRLPR